MRACALLFPLMVLTTASPAAAQAARSYACTLDVSNQVVRWKFGTGELRELENGVWSGNWCGDKYTVCEFMDSTFIVSDPFFEFYYDPSTGRFILEDKNSKGVVREMSGTCRPE